MRESCILLKETHYLCCLRKCMHTKRLYFDFEQEMWNVVKNLSCLQSVFAFKVFGNHFLSLEYFIFNLHVPNTNGTALFPQLFLLLACRRMTLVLTVVHIHNYMRLLLEEQDTDIHKKSVFWPASWWSKLFRGSSVGAVIFLQDVMLVTHKASVGLSLE